MAKRKLVDYTLKCVVSTNVSSHTYENGIICVRLTKKIGRLLQKEFHTFGTGGKYNDYSQVRAFTTQHLCDNQFGQVWLVANYDDGTQEDAGGHNGFTAQDKQYRREGSAKYCTRKSGYEMIK